MDLSEDIPKRYHWMIKAGQQTHDRITKIVIKLIAENLIVINVMIATNNKSPHNETIDTLIMRSLKSFN